MGQGEKGAGRVKGVVVAVVVVIVIGVVIIVIISVAALKRRLGRSS